MKLIFFLFFFTVALLGQCQSYSEVVMVENEYSLAQVVSASLIDQDRTKTFFALVKLGSVYLNNNKIAKCDSILLLVEKDYPDIIKSNTRWRSLTPAAYFQLLSAYYYVKSDNAKSKYFLIRAQQIDPDAFSHNNNLYRLFIKEGKLDSAEIYLQLSFPTLARGLDLHKLSAKLLTDYDLTFRNMCQLKIAQGDINGLKFYLSKWLPISNRKLSLGANSQFRGDSWQRIYLSKYFMLTGDLDAARKALNVPFGSARDLRLENHRTWAQFYYLSNNPDSTISNLMQTLALHQENIEQLFPSFTETERESYVSALNDDYDFLLSVVTENPSLNERHLARLFEFQLFRKGILLDITKKLNKIASSLNTTEAALLKQQIININDSISLLTFRRPISTTESKDSRLAKFNARKEHCERELLRLIQNQSSGMFKTVTTAMILEKLEPQSCLVEMIRFRRWVRDQKRIIGPQEISYAALVMSRTENPQMVSLSHGEELEGRYATYYRNAMQNRVNDSGLYDLYWAPIFNSVRNYKKVFLSPDGIYNLINVNTLQHAVTQRFMLDEMVLINLTSPKDLLSEHKEMATSTTALLLGYPTYSFESTDYDNGNNTLRGQILENLESIKEKKFPPLPATLEEIEIIGKIIKTNHGNAILLKEKEAQESNLKSRKLPEILHLATHGFFVSSDDKLANPLLQSGLILAGVNNKSFDEESGDDGILTALEITSLDLSETRLVVLSACETGLGEVKNGDGVYGLQRAFKLAEARYIILSMWKVDDDATMKLMTLFYNALTKSNDVIASFNVAQKELRHDYPDPYYWGAFKLFGY